MQTPLQPITAPLAPTASELTAYDRDHLIVYLRLLDAAADSAEWREVARLVLKIDPDHDPEAAHRTWESHLARARWMTISGYRSLLEQASPQ